jgi:hypothetical protein
VLKFLKRDTDAQLASDVRAGREARRRVRLIHRRILRERLGLFALMLAGGAVLTVVSAAIQRSGFMRGFTAGLMLAITVALVASLVILLGGTAPLMIGELAEQWTANQLRPMTRHGWRLANHVLVTSGDADHVAVGPNGVTVFETKWRREPWRLDGQDWDRDAALAQVRATARSISLLIGSDTPITRCVVLWTSQDRALPNRQIKRYGDTIVIPGPELNDWALRQGRAGLETDAADEAWARLSRHARATFAHEELHRPMPASFDEIARRWLVLFFSGVLGFLASGYVIRFSHSFVWWLAFTALLTLASFARVKWGGRTFTRALTVGALCANILGLGAVLAT